MYLSPGESKDVIVTLDSRAFSYYDDKNNRWTPESGEFDVLVWRSGAEMELSSKETLQGP